MNVTQIRTKMEELNDFVQNAEISARNGKVVSMAGLDRDVSTICARALALPPVDARDIQPLMAELIGNLDRLAMALRDYKDDLKK